MSVSLEAIASSSNQVIKYMRSLRHRHIRREEQVVIVEGWKMIHELSEAGFRPRMVLFRESNVPSILPPLQGSAVRIATDKVFDDLSTTVAPQHVMAAIPMPVATEITSDNPLLLIIDGLRDPGNMGTLFRSAVGAGVTVVITTPNSVDPWNDKAIRAGMGAQWQVPILAIEDDRARALITACTSIAGTSAQAALSYDSVDWRQPAALVIGGEVTGQTLETEPLVTVEVAIPLTGNVESLNAGVAGSIILFEAQRQRRLIQRS